jgi:hypothetical protein
MSMRGEIARVLAEYTDARLEELTNHLPSHRHHRISTALDISPTRTQGSPADDHHLDSDGDDIGCEA